MIIVVVIVIYDLFVGVFTIFAQSTAHCSRNTGVQRYCFKDQSDSKQFFGQRYLFLVVLNKQKCL